MADKEPAGGNQAPFIGNQGGQPDAWLVNSPKVKVDIRSLKDFADGVNGELNENFLPSMERGLKELTSAGRAVPFGLGGLSEGAWFRGRHNDNMGAITQLLGHVRVGLMALSAASMSIAMEYEASDGLNSVTTDAVYGAFNPTDGPHLGMTPEQLKAEGVPLPEDVKTVAESKEAEAKAGKEPTGPGGDQGATGPYQDQTFNQGTPWEFRVHDDEETGVSDPPPSGYRGGGRPAPE